MAEEGSEPSQIDWTPEAGERLERLISLAGGPTAAGRIAGKSDEALARYKRGDARWDCWAVARLCRATGYSLDWLVHGHEGIDRSAISALAVEEAADFVIRAAREFPELEPREIARSIVRRARDLEEVGTNLTPDQEMGDKHTSR